MSKVGAIVFLLLISACAQKPTFEQMARTRAEQAEPLIKSGSYAAAFNLIELDIPRSSEAVALLRKYPTFAEATINAYRASIDRAATPAAFAQLADDLDRLEGSQAFSRPEIAELRSEIDKKASQGNATGAIPFLLTDRYEPFPSLGEKDAQSIIFYRSLDRLKSAPNEILATQLFQWASNRKGSQEFIALETALPQLKLSRRTLEATVARLYPSYAETALRKK